MICTARFISGLLMCRGKKSLNIQYMINPQSLPDFQHDFNFSRAILTFWSANSTIFNER